MKNSGLIPYHCKYSQLPGTDHQEVWKQAQRLYATIKKRTKRRPYIRSAFFNKEKVFFDFFWQHLADKKSRKVKTNRLKYFAAALDLIRYSKNQPISKENPNKRSELLHRFAGLTKEKELFFVQIKEHKRKRSKQLMSVFAPR